MKGSGTMGEVAKKENVPKVSFFKGLETEFKKISWPNKQTLFKQSIAVVSVSIVMGVIITLLDTIIKYGVNFLKM